jgi:hypothetical protein
MGMIVAEPAGQSQPGRALRSVRIEGSTSLPTSLRDATLTGSSSPSRATTKDPHVHERWDEARKLELAYCINFVPGEDEEAAANHAKLVRSLVTTTAEWERASGANYIHLREDDEPTATPYVSVLSDGRTRVDAARCASGTEAYLGVVAGFYTGSRDGQTNALPQRWDDPSLEDPRADAVARILQVNSGLVATPSDLRLLSTLRHELGHVMGFVHEEASLASPPEACGEPGPRPLTPTDRGSVMATPACAGLDDADLLSPRDRLSAFFLHHTPRGRFEARGPSVGYRFGGGPQTAGAEILWHSPGAMEAVRWRPQPGPGVSFVAEPFPYVSPGTFLPEGWYPSQSEVVIPLRLGGSERHDLLFFGPGPAANDFAVVTTDERAVLPWEDGEFAVPVVGRFDPDDLDRDVVYLYGPGPEPDRGLVLSPEGTISLLEDVQPQEAHAYPLAAPYRGPNHPDDILWLDPQAETLIFWRWGSDVLEGAATNAIPLGTGGLPRGELAPVIGDFDGNGQADVLWHGVSALPAHPDIEDVLWLFDSTDEDLAFDVVPKAVGAGYRPFVGDFDADGRDDVFWHRQWGMTATGPSETDTGPSFVWYFAEDGSHEARAFVVGGDHSPYVGDFDADGCHDIAWFDAVDDTLHVWRCLPGARDFDCEAAMATPPGAAPVGVHWGY